MEPINTHRTLPTSPITSCFNGRGVGIICTFSKRLRGKPSGAGKLRMAMGIRRVISALTCASETPGLRRATPGKLKFPSFVLLRSHCMGR